jgi:hypothetical protein
MPHLSSDGDDAASELCLRALKLEVTHEDPRQRAREKETDGNDAGGRGEETKPEAQLPASSSR